MIYGVLESAVRDGIKTDWGKMRPLALTNAVGCARAYYGTLRDALKAGVIEWPYASEQLSAYFQELRRGVRPVVHQPQGRTHDKFGAMLYELRSDLLGCIRLHYDLKDAGSPRSRETWVGERGEARFNLLQQYVREVAGVYGLYVGHVFGEHASDADFSVKNWVSGLRWRNMEPSESVVPEILNLCPEWQNPVLPLMPYLSGADLVFGRFWCDAYNAIGEWIAKNPDAEMGLHLSVPKSSEFGYTQQKREQYCSVFVHKRNIIEHMWKVRESLEFDGGFEFFMDSLNRVFGDFMVISHHVLETTVCEWNKEIARQEAAEGMAEVEF